VIDRLVLVLVLVLVLLLLMMVMMVLVLVRGRLWRCCLRVDVIVAGRSTGQRCHVCRSALAVEQIPQIDASNELPKVAFDLASLHEKIINSFSLSR